MINEIKTSDLICDPILDRASDYFIFFDSADETQADSGSTKRASITALDASVWSVSASYNLDKILPAYNTVNSNSGNWCSTFTSVKLNSAYWNSAFTYSNGASANIASSFTTLNANSANWNSVFSYTNGVSSKNAAVYTSVNANSALWNTTSIIPGISALTANLSGGTPNQILVKTNNTDGKYEWRNKRIVYTFPSISASQAISFNSLSADHFIVPMSGTTSLTAFFTAPTNPYDGQMLMWDVRHNTSNSTVVLCADFRIPSASLSWSSLSGKMDVMAAKYNSLDSKWDVVSFLPGFSF